MKKSRLIFENKSYSTNSILYAMWKKKEQYYIVGTSGVDNSYGYLIKYDSSGNVIWAKDVGGYYGITSVK